jgi:hypothetical protein
MTARAWLALAFAGAAFALSACSHPAPLPPAPTAIVMPPPAPVDHTIGSATMLKDGTIVLEMNTSMDGGPGHLTQRIRRGDVQYASTLKRIGGLRPGETKALTEYPVQ